MAEADLTLDVVQEDEKEKEECPAAAAAVTPVAVSHGNSSHDIESATITGTIAAADAAIIQQFRRRHQSKFTLYDEVIFALYGAFLMFCLPDLKALAAMDGMLQGDSKMIQRIIDMPVSLYEIYIVYAQNKELLTQERLKCEDRAQLYHDFLSLERYFRGEGTEKEKQIILNNIIIHVLDDVHEQEACVYLISENKINQIVTIAFRGSVTKKDFQQDAKALLTYVENPIAKIENDNNIKNNNNKTTLDKRIGLHLGFKEYLYGSSNSSSSKNNKNKEQQHANPKYKIILDQAAALMQDGYHLKIVGHSLGGALTTVLALEAAADNRFPSPITAITSGAPKVGNLSFLQTFEYFEKTQRLRCIQVANNKDPVTQSPPVGNFDPCAPICCRHVIFRHVGLRLHLTPNGFVIWHPMLAKSYPGILVFDWLYVFTNCGILMGTCCMVLCCFSALSVLAIPLCCCATYGFLKKSRMHHTQLKYIHRIEFSKNELEQLYLDELNDIRFGRSPYRLSRILVQHHSRRKSQWYNPQTIYDTVAGTAGTTNPAPPPLGANNATKTKTATTAAGTPNEREDDNKDAPCKSKF